MECNIPDHAYGHTDYNICYSRQIIITRRFWAFRDGTYLHCIGGIFNDMRIGSTVMQKQYINQKSLKQHILVKLSKIYN